MQTVCYIQGIPTYSKDVIEGYYPIKIKSKLQGQPVILEIAVVTRFSQMPFTMFEKIRRFGSPLKQTEIKL